MIRRDAQPIEHRPPRARIEIGQRLDVDRRREITEALSGISPVERDRIWRLVEQTARGVGAPDEADPEPRSVIVDDVVHHVNLRDVIDAQEAQLLEARQHQVEEICRAMGGDPLFLTRAQAIRLMGDDE